MGSYTEINLYLRKVYIKQDYISVISSSSGIRLYGPQEVFFCQHPSGSLFQTTSTFVFNLTV